MTDVDAIERAARAASDQATGALSVLVGQKLLARTEVSVRGSLPEGALDAEDALGIRFGVQGRDGSEFVALLPRESLRTVRALLAPGTGDELGEDAVALEVGNICASHYLAALADAVGLEMLPSPPELVAGTDPHPDEPAVLVHTVFRAESGATFDGTLLFRPAKDLLDAMRRAG